MKMPKEIYNKIVDYTHTDYEPFTNKEEKNFVMLDEERLLGIIEDLLIELNYRDEELEDLKKDINENYIPVRTDPYDELGINENDF